MSGREGRRVRNRPLWVVKGTCTTNAAHELRAARCDFKTRNQKLRAFVCFSPGGVGTLPRFKRMDVSCVTGNE